MTPRFDELVGPEVGGEERERLRRAHDALVAAGAPAELPPSLARPRPRLAVVRGPSRRRLAALAAAAAAAALTVGFGGGYLLGKRAVDGVETQRSLPLRATSLDPDAWGLIRVGKPDAAGNSPMVVEVENLDPLSGDGYYEVVLTRDGKRVGPCGTFDVDGGETEVYLNAPYDVRRSDGWIVVVHRTGHVENAPVVLTTT